MAEKHSDIKYNPQYIDNLLQHLQDHVLKEADKENQAATQKQQLENSTSQAGALLIKVETPSPSDEWYEEVKGRELVIDYLSQPEFTETLKPYHKKIVQIYDLLSTISREKGTWADGIDQEMLHGLEPPDETLQDDHPINLLENNILTDIFLAETPEEKLEEQVLEKLAQTEKQKTLDPAAKTHVFTPVEKLKAPDDRQLFHIHANEFGASSELEGSEGKFTVQYLADYLRAKGNYSEIVNELDGVLNLQLDEDKDDKKKSSDTKSIKFSYPNEEHLSPGKIPVQLLIDYLKATKQNWMAKIVEKKLNSPHEPGESFEWGGLGRKELADLLTIYGKDKISKAMEQQKPLLIIGGWSGNPGGHAIYYEIIPTSDNKANFRLFNTGAGSDYHPSEYVVTEHKAQSYVEWKGIERDKLESPLFLEALHEFETFQTLPGKETKTTFNKLDIYSGLRHLLQPEGETNGPESLLTDQLMSSQKSGICAWKSLMAFLRTKMELNDYKRFKCDIKLQSLGDFVHTNSEGILVRDWRLVKKSYQNLCRSLLILHQNQLVGEEYMVSAQKALEPVAAWIKQHKNCCFDRGLTAPSFKYEPLVENVRREIFDYNFRLKEQKPLHEITTGSEEEVAALSQKHLFVLDDFKKIDTSDSKAILENLENALSVAQKAWNAGEDLSLYKGILDVVTKLEMDREFWQKAIEEDPEKAKALIASLGSMAQLFTKSCFTIEEPEVIHPEKVYVFHKILHLQEMICHLGLSDTLWSSLSLSAHELPTSYFFTFANQKMNREMKQIEESKLSGDSIPLEKMLIGDEIVSPKNQREGVGLALPFLDAGRSEITSFADLLRRELPEIINEISLKEENFTSLPKNSQDARIFTSPLLPSFVKAMRDTKLASLHVELSSVGRLETLDRTLDLQQQFTLEDTKDTTKVFIGFSGVNNSITNNSKVMQMMASQNNRYEMQYKKPEKYPIIKFIGYLKLITGKQAVEKSISMAKAQDVNVRMADEDFKELATLFTPSNTQLIDTLAYFTRHPEKLKEPDYQILFQTLLFKIGSIDQNLKVQGFKEQLSNFIEKYFEQFKEENEIQTAVFLLRMAHQLQTFIPDQPFFQNTQGELEKLLLRKGLETDDQCAIYAELVAELGQKSTLNEKEVEALITGAIYLGEKLKDSLYKPDPTLLKATNEAVVSQASSIKEILLAGHPNQALLNRILHRLRPSEEAASWQVKENPEEFPYFITTDENHLLFPLAATLTSSEAPILLPAEIRNNSNFKTLFPDIQEGFLKKENVFSFKDAKGREVLVQNYGDYLLIDRKIGEKWYRFVPQNTLIERSSDCDFAWSKIGNSTILQKCMFWKPLQESLEIGDFKMEILHAFEQDSDLPNYVLVEKRAAVTGRFEDLYKYDVLISRQSDHATLGKCSPLMKNFEDESYIQEWYDSEGKLLEIELPRYQLSFKPDPKSSDKLISKEFPGYFLNFKDAVKQLGVHHNYLLLEKDSGPQKGHKKVILPKLNLQTRPKKEVLTPSYFVDKRLDIYKYEPQQYYTFDLQKNGRLLSQSREANLYLSYVASVAGEYKTAAFYLKKFGEKLSPYNPEEKKMIEKITNLTNITGDESANATAIKLYAKFLLIKNDLASNKEFPKDEVWNLIFLYWRYLDRYSNITVLKLAPQEELLLLKLVLNRQFAAPLYLRLKELDPTAARDIKIPVPTEKDAKSKTVKPFTFKIPDPRNNYFSSFKKPEHHILLTRHNEALQERFMYFYGIALKGTEDEKQRLRTAVEFLSATLKKPKSDMATFFRAMLAFPDRFPEFSWALDQEDPSNWQAKVLEAAIKSVPELPIIKPASPPKRNQTDLSTIEPHFDSPTIGKRSVKLTITTPILKTFAEECLEKGCFQKKGKVSPPYTAGLAYVLKTFEAVDPVEKKEIKRLENDLNVYKKQIPPPKYGIDQKGIEDLSEILNREKEADTTNLESSVKQILALANKLPETNIGIIEREFQKKGGLHKVITMDELVVNFSRMNPEELTRRNPALSDDDINQLMQLVCNYLHVAVRQQQRVRAAEILEKLKAIPETEGVNQEREDLVQQLADTLLPQRAYDPVKRPAFLVFEYFANLSMRKAQVDKLELFLKGGNSNLIMEMIMGSGKSKVLLPLLGLLRADGKALSMLIVPESLFESVSKDTQIILQEGFSQDLLSLHFDRDTKFTKEGLEVILKDLEDIRDNKKCLIMKSKAVQSLILKYVEEYANHLLSSNKDSDLPDEIKIMQKIITLFINNGYPIIDEVDSILSVLHEVCFSVGKRLNPKKEEIETIAAIYELIYENEDIKQLAALDSSPEQNQDAPPITDTLYHAKVKPALANAFIDKLQHLTFSSKTVTEKVQEYSKNLNERNRTLLFQYITRDKDHIAAAQRYYDQLDPDIKNIVSLAGEEISSMLAHTLTKRCDEKYGIDEKTKGIFAIPFSAAKTPNTGSQFSNSDITMNYTFQTYMKKGVTKEMVEEQVKALQEKAMKELRDTGGKMTLKDTEAAKAFAGIKGTVDIPLFNYKPIQIETLTQEINRSSALKRDFVSKIILPQLETFEKKISCNPINLIALFVQTMEFTGKVLGFTGTLWDADSMHHKMQPVPEAGTDAKTLGLLWKYSLDNAISIKEGSVAEMLAQLRTKGVEYDMISDAGGYFKEGTNNEVAHALKEMIGKEVVYYSEKGEQTQTGKGKDISLAESNLPPSERLTFLDQSHTTGADVPQKRDAISLVTIGRNMLLRDLLQSVWRLRGLEKSQRIRFVVSDEVAEVIRQTLNISHKEPIQFDAILKFVVYNQKNQQGKDNYKSLKQELANLPQQILFNIFLNEKLNPKARQQALTHLLPYWIKPATLSPSEKYGKLSIELDGQAVAEMDRLEALGNLEDLFQKLPWLEQIGIHKQEYIKEINTIVNSKLDTLPAKLKTPSQEIEDDQTVELSTETEKETQTELEAQESSSSKKIHCAIVRAVNGLQEFVTFKEAVDALGYTKVFDTYSPDYVVMEADKCPAFSFKSYLDSEYADSGLKPFKSAFEGIGLTMNVLEWPSNKQYFALLGSHRIEFQHCLIEGSKVTLLSQEEATHELNNPNYYNLTLGFTDPTKTLTSGALLKIVKLKFLNGESSYSKEELKLLQQWISVQGKEKMERLFVDKILSGFPKKMARYNGSPLQKLLR